MQFRWGDLEARTKSETDGLDFRSRQLDSARQIPLRGFALMSLIGTSSLLLLLAAVLLAQLFAHRSVAFAGVLALIILYVAALQPQSECSLFLSKHG